MIAEVYPFRRMPRRFSHFDYSIPEGMSLSRGQFVLIPFRSKTCVGIVKRVTEKPPRGIILKNISSIFFDTKLRDEELFFFESVAKSIVQSVSTLLFTAIPRPTEVSKNQDSFNNQSHKLTISNNESLTIARLSHEITKRREAFVQAPDLRRTCAIIARFLYERPHQKSIIVCPNVRDARIVAQFLSTFFPECVTGEESNNERFASWKFFREKSEGLLVTTRTGLFFADEQTSTVIIVRSGHSNHIEHRRNPRVSAREIARSFSQKFNTKLIFFDVLPCVDDLQYFKEENLLLFNQKTIIDFVCPSAEKLVSEHSAVVYSTFININDSLEKNGKVLIILNKKGYAWKLRCKNCGYIFACSSCGHTIRVDEQTITCIHCKEIAPIPVRCRACQSSLIEFRGFGISRIAEVMHESFPTVSIQLVDAQNTNFDPTVSITLATRAFLENNFDPSKDNVFQCIVYLDADLPLFSQDFRSAEQAIINFYEWFGMAHANRALFIVQTEESDFYAKSVDEPLKILKEELALRQSFHQPPFERWVEIKIRESEEKKRELRASFLRQRLEKIDGVRVTNEFVVRVPQSSFSAVQSVFSDLDDDILVDINAFS